MHFASSSAYTECTYEHRSVNLHKLSFVKFRDIFETRWTFPVLNTARKIHGNLYGNSIYYLTWTVNITTLIAGWHRREIEGGRQEPGHRGGHEVPQGHVPRTAQDLSRYTLRNRFQIRNFLKKYFGGQCLHWSHSIAKTLTYNLGAMLW
jgi:hypothetical protein